MGTFFNHQVFVLSGAVVLAAALLALLLYVVQKLLLKRGESTLGVHRKQLLTPNEVDFFKRLQLAAGGRWVVLAQVSMGALIDTTANPRHPKYWAFRQAFSSKICDFVLCDARTMAPVLIVELDDRMHDFDRDRSRDNFVAAGGYRTLRFWSRKKPSAVELRERLYATLAPLDEVPAIRNSATLPST